MGAGLCLALAWGMSATLALGGGYVPLALTTFIAMMLVALAGVGGASPFDRLGPANLDHGRRAVITALIAGAIDQAPTRALAWTLVVDRHRWRRCWTASTAGPRGATGMSSPFGARFDMEVDAFLILVLAALAWRFDKAGAVGAGVGPDALRVRGRRLAAGRG